MLISAAWKVLYAAQRQAVLHQPVLMLVLRHPQYLGFILVMFGFLLQWPTLLTLAMFPVLVVMYVQLAKGEEREALAEFGDRYRDYAAGVNGFSAAPFRLSAACRHEFARPLIDRRQLPEQGEY